MNSSKYLQDFSKWVVLIIIWTSWKTTNTCNSYLVIHSGQMVQNEPATTRKTKGMTAEATHSKPRVC
jgi:hypothetical protein